MKSLPGDSVIRDSKILRSDVSGAGWVLSAGVLGGDWRGYWGLSETGSLSNAPNITLKLSSVSVSYGQRSLNSSATS